MVGTMAEWGDTGVLGPFGELFGEILGEILGEVGAAVGIESGEGTPSDLSSFFRPRLSSSNLARDSGCVLSSEWSLLGVSL